MKKFVLTTQSESSDDYIYFIKCSAKPTSKQIKKFLLANGNDVDTEDNYCFEDVVHCVEIKETDFIEL